MPLKRTIEKARQDRRESKSPSTQAGEFVKEEIDKVRRGEHGARSLRQAIAIGLSEARRAGVPLPPPKKGRTTRRTRKSAEYAYAVGQGKRKSRRQPRVSRAVSRVLKREPRSSASHAVLSRQAKRAAPAAAAPHARAPRGKPDPKGARAVPPPCARQRAPSGAARSRDRASPRDRVQAE
jgi:hypothetical protein